MSHKIHWTQEIKRQFEYHIEKRRLAVVIYFVIIIYDYHKTVNFPEIHCFVFEVKQ